MNPMGFYMNLWDYQQIPLPHEAFLEAQMEEMLFDLR